MDIKTLETTIISQYANSPILVQLIEDANQNIDILENTQDFYDAVFNPATAEGFGLDIWGRIVGVSRFVEVFPVGDFFGFYNPAFSDPNQVYTPFNVAPFFSTTALTPTIPVDDDTYRKMIFAKAYANLNPPTVPTFNKLLEILIGVGNAYTEDNLDMSMQFVFLITLTAIDEAVIFTSGIMPIPAGVRLIIL